MMSFQVNQCGACQEAFKRASEQSNRRRDTLNVILQNHDLKDAGSRLILPLLTDLDYVTSGENVTFAANKGYSLALNASFR